jgi:hypothetical protein
MLHYTFLAGGLCLFIIDAFEVTYYFNLVYETIFVVDLSLG